MSWIDFIIGATLMNAMPHFVLGTWKARILSAFGFGHKQNIMYSMLNFIIAVGLFAYKYGGQAIMENGIFAGALTVLLIYFVFGQLVYRIFKKTPDA
jgi:hypothetical protein